MPEQSKGPYDVGVNRVEHRGVITTTVLNVPEFDDLLENLSNKYEYEVGYVPAGYEHRPDLISHIFYGSPKNWWLLCVVNGISDPFEGFQTNQRILIPIL